MRCVALPQYFETVTPVSHLTMGFTVASTRQVHVDVDFQAVGIASPRFFVLARVAQQSALSIISVLKLQLNLSPFVCVSVWECVCVRVFLCVYVAERERDRQGQFSKGTSQQQYREAYRVHLLTCIKKLLSRKETPCQRRRCVCSCP